MRHATGPGPALEGWSMRKILAWAVFFVTAVSLTTIGGAAPAGSAVLNPDKGLSVRILEAGHAYLDQNHPDVCIFTAKVRVTAEPNSHVHQLKARFQLYPPFTTVAGSVASTGTLKSPPFTAAEMTQRTYWDFRGTIRLKDTIGQFDYKVTPIGDRDAPRADLAFSKVPLGDDLGCQGASPDARRKAPPKCPRARVKKRLSCVTRTAIVPTTVPATTATTAPPPTAPPPTEPPATEPPATEPPATEPPVTNGPPQPCEGCSRSGITES